MSSIESKFLAVASGIVLAIGMSACGKDDNGSKEKTSSAAKAKLEAKSTHKEVARQVISKNVYVRYIADGTREIVTDNAEGDLKSQDDVLHNIFEFCVNGQMYSQTEGFAYGYEPGPSTVIVPGDIAKAACADDRLTINDFNKPQ